MKTLNTVRELLIDQHAPTLKEIREIIRTNLSGKITVKSMTRHDMPPARLEYVVHTSEMFRTFSIFVKRDVVKDGFKWTIDGVGGLRNTKHKNTLP